MQNIHEQVRGDIGAAMKAGEKDKLLAARNLLTAFTNELVAKGQKPSEFLSDEDALVVVSRMAKQRKEAIAQFREGARDDLVKAEEQELRYLERYLPEMMGRDEIRRVVETKKRALGVEDKSAMGKLMGAVMAELKGKADGNEVKALVEKLLK